jgi:signal recognition particle receptor subunit alpha
MHSNETSTDVTPIATPDNSRPNTPLANHLLSAKPGGKISASRRARKVVNPATASSGDEDMRRKSKPAKGKAKTQRKWDADGMADEDDGTTLDYSTPSLGKVSLKGDDSVCKPTGMDSISMESFGTRTGKGQFVLKDLDDEVHSILKEANKKKSQPLSQPSKVLGSSFGVLSGLFRNVIGGKVLSKLDLEKPMRGMEEHLLKKNVAREAAVRLCEGVERELIGIKTGSFESKSP